MRLRNIYSVLLATLCGIAFTASAETCFESTCHVDKDGTLWCTNQVVSHAGSCTDCGSSACSDCVNCDYTVPIREGDELDVDEQRFGRCGTTQLPPQYYSGNRGGISGDGDGDDMDATSFYNDHARWYLTDEDWNH